MTEETFHELFVLLQPHMQDYGVNRDGIRSCSKRHLLLVVSSLAHVPTMRCSWRMYQQSTSRQADWYCQKTGTDRHEPEFIGMMSIHLIIHANNVLSIRCSLYMYQQSTSLQHYCYFPKTWTDRHEPKCIRKMIVRLIICTYCRSVWTSAGFCWSYLPSRQEQYYLLKTWTDRNEAKCSQNVMV